MTPLPGMPGPEAVRPPERLERRIRRDIMLVAAAAVLMTAVPFVILSVASGVRLEQRKAGFVAAQIERNLRQRVEAYVADIAGLAAAPILGTGLTDSAGRQTYLGPFLQQRAAATASRLRLFDYRGRLLLDTAAEVPVPPPVLALPQDTASLVREDAFSVTAPISLLCQPAADRRAGGADAAADAHRRCGAGDDRGLPPDRAA
ncbi:hypothetical protein [Dankookia sp. P2]|uniref:hypothetical protein n=1 Tax=Dankookia sp. P2 TaxID=3423955 RepID=UPI003D67AD62